MEMRKFSRRILVGALLTVAISCDKESTPSATFDRGPLLENLGESVILPAYDTLTSRALRLETAAEAFAGNAGAEELSALRDHWLAAYIAFQHCAYFNFGPADELLLNTALNTFPTSKVKVDDNIASGSYDLAAVSSNNAKGFSALDYLLYGTGDSDVEILEMYSADPDASQRKQYLLDVVTDIRLRSEAVFTKWAPAGDNYIGTFVSLTGNDVGSATGMLLNAAIQYLERDLRDNKIGIPLGIRSLNVPIPDNCEALHSEKSITLAGESTLALQNIYLGKGKSDGIGFDDYLAAINAVYNGGLLDDAIRPQLELAKTKVEAIPEPYSETVMNNQGPPTQAYQELQKLVILLKTDMMSALGILITYQDNDGD